MCIAESEAFLQDLENFEMAHKMVKRKSLRNVMKMHSAGWKLLKVVNTLHEDRRASASFKESEESEINVGVGQGCALTPPHFNANLDMVMKEMKVRTNGEGTDL